MEEANKQDQVSFLPSYFITSEEIPMNYIPEAESCES